MMTQVVATIDKLRDVVEHLAPSDRTFANSLIVQYDSRQTLSVKQWPFVQRLYDKAVASKTPAPAAPTNVGSVSKLVELFDNAKSSGIQFPKIRFGHEDHTIVMSLAGPNARFPGSINVVCDEVWLGRVTREGHYTNPRKTPEPINVKEVLAKLAANPMEEMVAYGKRSGTCCLCARTLTNPASIAAGIGPVCVNKWGL